MQIIPLAAVAAQTLKVVLGQQNCVLNVYQKSTGMYLDVTLEGQVILTGVLGRDRVRCVRQAYLGFIGDLAFMDTQGSNDPEYAGLGSRWVLMYLEPADLVETTISTVIDFQSRIGDVNAWVAANPLVLIGALDNGIQGVPYSSQITLQGQMANSAISWSVVGSLPAGLSLDSRTGVVSGTPTAGLTIVSFTLTAKDNLGRTATSAQTVKIGQTFTMATSLPGIMSLTRPSIGTYFDPTAVLQVAANNQPRIDYDPVTLALRGLLVEEQRTNLFIYSDQFDNSSWAKRNAMGVTANAAAAPDGSNNADAFVTGNVSNWSGVSKNYSVTIGDKVAVSCFYKSGTRSVVRHNLFDTTDHYVTYDLSTGTLVASGNIGANDSFGIQQLANSWFRVWICLASVSAATLECQLGRTGPTPVLNETLYAWGAQLEAGAFPTSYIPTAGAQVTRAADFVGLNALSPWFNPAEGTLFIEASAAATPPAGNIAARVVALAKDTTNYLSISRNSNGLVAADVVSNGAGSFTPLQSQQVPNNTSFKSVLAYALNNTANAVNGAVSPTDTSVSLPEPVACHLGQCGSGQAFWNGHIRKLRYFPRRLSNSEIQAMTA